MDIDKTLVDAKEDIIGVEVKSSITLRSLGKIETLMLDKLTGHVEYVILSYGGFLGIGDKFYPVPWKSLTYDANEGCFFINLDEDTIKASPGVEKENLASLANPNWHNEIRKFYSGTYHRHHDDRR